jgi:opacity protein-like surface antigen
MKINKVFIFFVLWLICFPVFALSDYKHEMMDPKKNHFIISLGGGAALSSDTGASKNFPSNNPITTENYDYDAIHNTQSAGLFNIFLGREWYLKRNFDVQAGLSYYYLGSLKATGHVTQGMDAPSSDTYHYDYEIQNQQLLVETKWLYVYKKYHPYLLVGLGASFNRAKDFDVHIPNFTAFSREYSGHSTTSFTYDVGVGLDYDVNPFTRLGLGYRFADLGKAKLGSAVIDTTSVSGTLSQSHLYTNELLIQLTFLI